ncbi:hypothetical protein PR202_gb00535 [Eleusine coracana subsp. coracana]|uniref:Uncharacterized protein n=1 Tax=Eleusine coracana subsp. coracana TaxID=191504 RepID=A0AAV5DTM4_ELECO|nr:hypothetical protein PR202_gb00535 [Eleusine coracana subsp. coracana]
MAKGDDALARKRNKVRRKRLRSSENAVSSRVAAIIASKKRRKSGKRRGCEGMCFSLPTPDDPFNDRYGKKRKVEEPAEEEIVDDAPAGATAAKDEVPKLKKKKNKDLDAKKQPSAKVPKAKSKAIRQQQTEKEEGPVDYDRPSKSCSAAAPRDVLDTDGACATLEQTAWLVSTACDIFARKERLGMVVSCPFLLYLVPTQEKATQVIDGLKSFLDLNVVDKLYSIRNAISSKPQITVFSDPRDNNVATIARNLVRGRVTRLYINNSVLSRSAFIAQYVHFCPSEEQKTSKVKEILEQILKGHAKKASNVLLVAASDENAKDLSSSLKLENCTVTDGSHDHSFTICSSVGLMNVFAKDRENMAITDVEEFETVLIVDLPPSADEYAEILTMAARHTVTGEVHSIFCNTDAPLAKPLAELLANCRQAVPDFLKNLESS